MTAQGALLADAVGWPVVLASLSLVALAWVLARALGLGIGRELWVSAARAAAQLLGVGIFFAAVFGSSQAGAWAWTWVVVMVVVATMVISRRARYPIRHLPVVALGVVGSTALLSIAITFGFGVIDYDPVSLVVIAGITIGNSVPSAVLGVNQAVTSCRARIGDLEALVSLGLDRPQIVRYLAPQAAQAAMIPQIERTKVVGLIALPGAMTGLLLAGVPPIEAVVVQLLVMYLILGTTAVGVVAVVTVINQAALTADLRVADWVRPER